MGFRTNAALLSLVMVSACGSSKTDRGFDPNGDPTAPGGGTDNPPPSLGGGDAGPAADAG